MNSTHADLKIHQVDYTHHARNYILHTFAGTISGVTVQIESGVASISIPFEDLSIAIQNSL